MRPSNENGFSRQDSSTRSPSSHPRPLPLKQRTSSVDTRRDYSFYTVFSLLSLIKLREYFITVDNFSIWRRHLAWANENGGDLRSYMTQRFASSMVFMSLLLGAELNVLFNSAAVTTSMRRELFAENAGTIEFWVGITILVSVILTILSLISTFTVWGMVSSVSDANAHCVLRSSIGQYVAELPGRFIVTAVYSFLIWVSLFFFLLLPVGFWSILLLVTTAALFFHVVVVFSAFGRIIMHSGAMGSHRIFDEATENSLLPHSLHTSLFEKAKTELARNTSIMRQYRRKTRPATKNKSQYDDDDDVDLEAPPEAPRKRTDSSVRFADTLWTSASPREPSGSSALSDIASLPGGSGSDPPSSQVSAVSSEKITETFQRSPRPAVNSSEDSSLLDATGVDSNSLEEWLNAGSAKPEVVAKTGNHNSRSKSVGKGRSATSSMPNTGHIEKPRVHRPAIGPVEFGTASLEQSRVSGRRSISPIDNDTSVVVGQESPGRPQWRPPSSVPMNRPTSANSSIDGSSTNFQSRPTEEEKFDQEYGESFDLEEAELARISQGYEVEYGHEESDLELCGTTSEQQRLLPEGRVRNETYAALGTLHNKDTNDKADA